jgi:hypothetical protein
LVVVVAAKIIAAFPIGHRVFDRSFERSLLKEQGAEVEYRIWFRLGVNVICERGGTAAPSKVIASKVEIRVPEPVVPSWLVCCRSREVVCGYRVRIQGGYFKPVRRSTYFG